MHQLSRSELKTEDRELLEQILLKSPQELTEQEVSVLSARRQYLSYAERKAYAELIPNDVEEEAGSRPDIQAQSTTWTKQPGGEEVKTEAEVKKEPVAEQTKQEEVKAEEKPQEPKPDNPYDVDPNTLT